MSIEDTIGCQHEGPTCIVCGKGVEGDRGFARIKHKGIMVNLCCPCCMEVFARDPEPQLARYRKVLHYREFKTLNKSWS